MAPEHRKSFWREAFALQGSITPIVVPYVLVFGLIATSICIFAWIVEKQYGLEVGLEVAPYEIGGAVLGLLLILRTNAGYERWWEARKLWGGIVNQCRNLSISALAYGPKNSTWKEAFVKWVAAFPHVACSSLRKEPPCKRLIDLIGPRNGDEVAKSVHMPSFIVLKLAQQLRKACDEDELDRFAFLQIDRERAALIDHIGACERILKTPLPLVYAIKIRRFIAIFLITLPFALLHRVQGDWLVPFITMLIAYPLVSLDQIGVELQNPFAKINLSHLPIGEISSGIEENLLGLLQVSNQKSIDSSLDGQERKQISSS